MTCELCARSVYRKNLCCACYFAVYRHPHRRSVRQANKAYEKHLRIRGFLTEEQEFGSIFPNSGAVSPKTG